jgi:hypothetical protein
MLRKKSNELKQTNAERRHNKRLIKEQSVLVETKKKRATPMSFAGFPTCFNFLRIHAVEEKNAKQICHLNGQNTQ